MAESYEDKFKTELYKKYEVCRKVLIPKDAYFTILDDLIKKQQLLLEQRADIDTICYQSKCISIHSIPI